MNQTIFLDMSFKLIQQVRLAQALAESNYSIAIPTSESSKFVMLRQKFGMEYLETDSGGVNISQHIRVSHEEPSTSVGKLNRPLIFPHAITRYCRSLWPKERSRKYSFEGLVTASRRELMRTWIRDNITSKTVRFPSNAQLISRFGRKIRSLLGEDDTHRIQIGDLTLWSSTRGRRFPVKAWDDQYFRMLADSQFVLCPSGDFVWSYRFFEAILCGAIPIIEKNCSAYEGFRFSGFEEAAGSLQWSEADATFNYDRCVDLITIPSTALDDELESLLAKYPALG